MSAPDYLFIDTGKLVATNEQGNVHRILTTTASASSPVLKQRFYIDFFVVVTDDNGKKSWAGACYVGSENYYMHNTSRHAWMQDFTSDGREYVVFWDAGLNTLGKVLDRPQLVSPVMTSMTVKANYKSAWYLDSRCQMEFRTWSNITNSWGLWFDYGLEIKPQQFEGELSFSAFFEAITPEMREHGIQFRGKITNDEGINYGLGSVSYFPTGVPITFVSPPITLYMTTSQLTPAIGGGGNEPTVLYKDPQLMNEWDRPGVELYLVYNANYRQWATYGYYAPEARNCVLEIKDWIAPPPTSPPFYDYQGYNMYDQNNAEMQVILGAGSNVGRFYFDVNNNTVHTSFGGTFPNWTFGNKAQMGYYASGDINVVQQVIYVDSNGRDEYVDPIN